MRYFNFSEVSEQLRKEIVHLVNRRNTLMEQREKLLNDLISAKELCNKHGSHDWSDIYLRIFNMVMSVERDLDNVQARLAECKQLRNDVDDVNVRYNQLANNLFKSPEYYSHYVDDSQFSDELIGMVLEELFSGNFDTIMFHFAK